jgi:hypothetical protein
MFAAGVLREGSCVRNIVFLLLFFTACEPRFGGGRGRSVNEELKYIEDSGPPTR